MMQKAAKRVRSESAPAPAPPPAVEEALAFAGEERIEWAARAMPVLGRLHARWAEARPFAGLRITLHLHANAEAAVFARLLQAAGASVQIGAVDPLSSRADVVAALRKSGLQVHASGDTRADLRAALAHGPHLFVDDGAETASLLHDLPALQESLLAATEESATGVQRLRARAAEGQLAWPVIALNEARTKQVLDNRHGTGQSVVDAIMRATNRLLAGSTFVVAGYGWSGRGIAGRARGLGAEVVVCEIDPIQALEAAMEGLRVLPMAQAARIGDFFCTATGSKNVITAEHFAAMKDGAVVCNAGRADVELDLAGLSREARPRALRPWVDEWAFPGGRRVAILASGRPVHLTVGEGHPAAVTDLGFAAHALCLEYLAREGHGLERRVFAVPAKIDREIARLKLEAMGVRIDRLSRDQKAFLASWKSGGD